MLNKFTQYSARFNQFYTGFFLIVDADDFFLAFETNCTKFRHALFPCKQDLYIHESNGNVRTYENQAREISILLNKEEELNIDLCPSHCSVAGNEMACKAAKQTMEYG